MNILRIADVLNNRTGGMSRAMYCTGDILQQAGHRVDYVFREDIPCNVPQQFRRFAIPLMLPPLVRRLNRKIPYDVVEIHEPLAALYCMGRQAGLRLPPVVVMSHGLEENGHTAELAYLRLKGVKPSLKTRFSPLSVVWQAAYSVRHGDHVICLNSTDYKYLESKGVSPQRITLQHSGVEDQFLQAGEYFSNSVEAAARPANLLFLGTWIPRKGILDVTTAVTSVMRRDAHVRLTVAGCQVAAESVLAEFPAELRPRIEVIPHLSGLNDVISVYARHSILLLPSYYEGHPIVMVEAAAMSMTIVATATCGMLDFIQDGRNGQLVPIGNPARLAEVISELLADPEHRNRLGASAFDTAKRHTWAAAASRLLAAYECAVARDRLLRNPGTVSTSGMSRLTGDSTL